MQPAPSLPLFGGDKHVQQSVHPCGPGERDAIGIARAPVRAHQVGDVLSSIGRGSQRLATAENAIEQGRVLGSRAERSRP